MRVGLVGGLGPAHAAVGCPGGGRPGNGWRGGGRPEGPGRERQCGKPVTGIRAAMAPARAAGEDTERILVVEGPGRVTVQEEPRAPLPAGAFRVTTLFSGVSAGTELSYVKGTNVFLAERWNADLGLFVPGAPNAGYPVTRLGYMEVGTV